MSLESFQHRWPSNVPGRFYVDEWCFDCDLCRVTLPIVFQRDEKWGQTYVGRQPETAEETAECVVLMEACPQSNIHGDGHLFDWGAIPSQVSR